MFIITRIYYVLISIRFLSFNCGIGDDQTHIAEGLAFSLEVFKDFEMRRKQKYFINLFNIIIINVVFKELMLLDI